MLLSGIWNLRVSCENCSDKCVKTREKERLGEPQMTTLQPQLRISMRSPWAERGGGSSAQDEAGWLQRRLMAQRKGAVQSDFQNVWSYYYFLSLNSVRFFCGQSNLIFTWISLKGSLCFMGQKILNSMGSPPENLLVSLSKQSYCFYLLVPSTLLPWVAKTLLWPPRGTSYWEALSSI